MSQVELTLIEQAGVEITVLDAPGAQVAVGPTLSSATPQPVGTTGAAGDSSSAAKANHIHAHGNQTGTSLHALATTAGAGFMSAAQFDLLAGATDSDTASTLVKRDASGNFEANVITADLTGNVTGNLTGTASAVADNSITSAKIVDGTIVNADISSTAAIAVSKLADGAARQVLQTNAAGDGVEWTDNLELPGNLTVTGNLTVNGTTTTVNTTTVEVEDKNLELGKVSSPTDTTADGGGITLKGATDKTINWVNATDAWTLSEHVDLASGKEYRIDGVKVLDALSLGGNVVSSSLTSVGTITTGTWEGDPISTAYGGLGSGPLPTDVTVTSANLVNGTIVDEDINASAAIALTKLGAGALPTDITIASANIVDGTIVNADVSASAAIALSKLATGALPTGITVASANLVNGTIVDEDISGTAAIALSKLATGALPTAITVASANLVNGTIVDEDINASAAIALSKLATGALPTGITVASANIVDGSIVDADVNASAAIALSKLAAVTAGRVVLGNASNVATATEITGDVTVNSSGVAAIGSGVIVDADVSASAAIAGSKVAPDFGAQNVLTTGKVTGGMLRSGTTVTRNVVPTNSNTSTTATAASLLTGIRTGTPSSNGDLQVPTGTDMDAAFVSLADNQAFEWSLINLSGNHTITVTANTNHTVVGAMVVAVNTSARFTTRKTAANTFITYRT
jgi:hypothetical protein